jgi:hypothetical protein
MKQWKQHPWTYSYMHGRSKSLAERLEEGIKDFEEKLGYRPLEVYVSPNVPPTLDWMEEIKGKKEKQYPVYHQLNEAEQGVWDVEVLSLAEDYNIEINTDLALHPGATNFVLKDGKLPERDNEMD